MENVHTIYTFYFYLHVDKDLHFESKPAEGHQESTFLKRCKYMCKMYAVIFMLRLYL